MSEKSEEVLDSDKMLQTCKMQDLETYHFWFSKVLLVIAKIHSGQKYLIGVCVESDNFDSY